MEDVTLIYLNGGMFQSLMEFEQVGFTVCCNLHDRGTSGRIAKEKMVSKRIGSSAVHSTISNIFDNRFIDYEELDANQLGTANTLSFYGELALV